MQLSEQQLYELGVALNEATLLGVEPDTERRQVAATFAVLTLPEHGRAPEDLRVQLVFSAVRRIAASLRHGRWNDRAAKVQPFTVQELLTITQSFRTPIYGWEFFNLDQSRFDWLDRLSLDTGVAEDNLNSFSFFQEDGIRHLDICVWFDNFAVYKPDGRELSIDEFTAGGKRWWDAFYGHDKRTEGLGLYPLK